MEAWQRKALEYAAQGLSAPKAAELIENELGLTDMHNKVRWYIYSQKKKGVDFDQLSYLPPSELVEKTNRVAIQNQEPKHYEGKWDGTQTLRFGLMGDTQFGSKYVPHTFSIYWKNLLCRSIIFSTFALIM